MGCAEENSVTVQENKKHFHEMSEEEKEKIKKQIEEQDRNLQLDEQEDGESRSYERYNWDELIKKLPVAKTKEDRKKRLDLWRKINEYGNGYISFKRLDYQLDKYLELPNIVKNKGPIKLAFNAEFAFLFFTLNKYMISFNFVKITIITLLHFSLN